MTTTNTKPAVTVASPAYVTFCKDLTEECRSQGLGHYLKADTETGLPQNAGYAFLRFSEDGAAVIVPKAQGAMREVHSHLDLSGFDGFIALPKRNGRVLCHFAADLTLLAEVLPLFDGASKRPVAKPVRQAKAEQAQASATASDTTPALTVADTAYAQEEERSWEMAGTKA